jgi:hypothetical protein
MKIAVIDDYQDAFRALRCYPKLDRHEVVVYNDTEKDPVRLAERRNEATSKGRTMSFTTGSRSIRFSPMQPATPSTCEATAKK